MTHTHPYDPDCRLCQPYPGTLRHQIRTTPDSERLALALGALIATGYFTADEIGPDIAPRITELWAARLSPDAWRAERTAKIPYHYTWANATNDSGTYRLLDPDPGASAMFCAKCDHPMHWHECLSNGRRCLCRNDVALDPDPLAVPDEPLDPDTSTIPDPAAWADTGSGSWLGCGFWLLAFIAGFVIGRFVL